MQCRALGGRNQISGGARARRFGKLHALFDIERSGDAIKRFDRLGKCAFSKIPAGSGDPEAADAAIDFVRHRLDRASSAGCIVIWRSLHGVIGEREIAHRSCERPEMV